MNYISIRNYEDSDLIFPLPIISNSPAAINCPSSVIGLIRNNEASVDHRDISPVRVGRLRHSPRNRLQEL